MRQMMIQGGSLSMGIAKDAQAVRKPQSLVRIDESIPMMTASIIGMAFT